jgi:hypothetical protein
MIIFSIISMALAFYVTLSGTIDDAQWTVADTIGTFIFVISIPIFIIFLVWFYRAIKNINSFGAKYVNSPGMAVVWWFITIMNLWKPHEVAQQIWRASNPEIKLTEGTEWRKIPSSNIITIWWVLGLVSIFAAIVIDVVIDPEQAQDPLSMSLYQNIVTIPAVVISIISIIYFIRMIRQISAWQDRKSIVADI